MQRVYFVTRRGFAAAALMAAVAGAGALLTGCPPAPVAPAAASADARAISEEIAALQVRWRAISPRRQSTYLRLDLPVIMAGMRVTIDDPLLLGSAGTMDVPAPAASEPGDTPESSDGGVLLKHVVEGTAIPVDWRAAGGEISVYSARLVRGGAEGPMVDQLTGQPRSSADAGSYLVPLAALPEPGAKAGTRSFAIREPMPVYVKLTVPAGIEPGEYRFRVRIESGGAGAAGAKKPDESMLALTVSDLSVPSDPRVLGVITTNIERLAAMYPDTFGNIAANYLDRGNPEHEAAVAQLDALVRAAHDEGVALFVEDVTPGVKLNEAGFVTLDWDAYDRVMQPYMDGSAFADRIPMPVWLAPVPPGRIRNSPTQLWQYIQGCAEHYKQKGWTGTAAMLHPALAGEISDDVAARALQGQVADVVRLHWPREMLVAATPDVGWSHIPGAGGGGALAIPQGQLWAVADGDARLPPAGALATEQSVRLWPWVCVARTGDGINGGANTANPGGGGIPGVKGFIWRDALAAASEIKPHEDVTRKPLFIVGKAAEFKLPDGPDAILPTLRMLWLSQGLNDSALLGLLEKRSDAALVSEVLAGVVGRTGLRSPENQAGGTAAGGEPSWPPAPPGFIYAGWPADRGLWQQVSPMLERLVLANDPGTRVAVSPNDRTYLEAKQWLAQSRRAVARVSGFDFSFRPGREGDFVDTRVELFLENPVGAAAELDLRFSDLPGDFEVTPLAAPPAPGELPGVAPALPVTSDGLRRRTVSLAASAAGRAIVPMSGHVNSLTHLPEPQRLDLTEHHGGAVLRLPMRLPIYRTHDVNAGGVAAMGAPKMDGLANDWPQDAQVTVYGQMTAATRYLARPDLLSARPRDDDEPAVVRWGYDDNFIYFFARCPQDSVSDDRTTDWPITDGRWWDSDGLQVQLADVDGKTPRIVQVAFKPGGVVLVKSGQLARNPQGQSRVEWRDGAPAGAGVTGGANGGVKYGIVIERQEGRVTGYTVEAAIPRAWIPGVANGAHAPAWRLNVLRHRAGDLSSASWSGPVINDEDLAMMGLLIGE